MAQIKDLINRIERRREAAIIERQHWDGLHQAVKEMLDPHFETIYGTPKYRNKGTRGDKRIYDSKGVRGNILLQQFLHALAYPPNQQIIRYITKDKSKMRENPRLVKWFARIDEDINSELQDSNFHPKISESMPDYTTIGILAHLLETYPLDSDRYGDFIFRAFPFDQIYPIEGDDGEIHTIIREYAIPAFHLMEKPEFQEAVEKDEALMSKVKNEPDELIEIVHYLTPKNKDMQPALGTQEYVSLYYTMDDMKPLNMFNGMFRGYDEKPFGFGRWMTRAGQAWPRSPAMTVLGDAESLQALGKLRLTAAAMSVSPPTYSVANQMLEDPKFMPGANNKVYQPSAMGYIEPRNRMDVAYTEGTYLAQNVDDGFFINDFQFPKDLPQMTALEAGLRNAIQQSVLAPTLALSQYSHLKPLAIRMFWMRYRAGYYEPPPVELRPNELDITIVSPLAKAQRQNEVVLSEGYIRFLAEVGQVFPEMLMKIDQKKYAQWRAYNTSSAFSEWIRPDEEVEAEMQQQQQLAMLQQGAPVAKDAAKAALDISKAQNL